ncbi:MAG: helix-turn-helix domain-containing protein [Bdellovibrionota bacterium]
MILHDQATYYDVLDLTPDASPQEIRSAYLRAKAAYNKDSVALYTLISEEETHDHLRKIEEAYEILSNTDRRKAYDRDHGSESVNPASKIVSIDRVPPMDDFGGDSDLLIPPSTDIGEESLSMQAPTQQQQQQPLPPKPSIKPKPTAASGGPVRPFSYSPFRRNDLIKRVSESQLDPTLEDEIGRETEWKGAFLRKVRDSRKISLEELSDFTKISKSYIMGIEDENYSRLPAPVYLRGFVLQIAKCLRLPQERVASAYMARFHQARSAK